MSDPTRPARTPGTLAMRLRNITFAVGLLCAFACSARRQAVSNQAETPPAAKDEDKANQENPVVLIKTSMGDIAVELYEKKAPLTVANFLEYVDDEHYSGTVFHRVIADFMIQGGGMTKDGKEKKTRDPIKNEAANGVKNDRGTIAMARTSEVDSASSQFFINTVDNDFLNHKSKNPKGFGYCAFGKVTEGMDVVDKIRAVKTGAGDKPIVAVEIVSISRQEKKK
jgi:cyclophilin family peptidyl-prolyl cis-trans isomerase